MTPGDTILLSELIAAFALEYVEHNNDNRAASLSISITNDDDRMPWLLVLEDTGAGLLNDENPSTATGATLKDALLALVSNTVDEWLKYREHIETSQQP